MSGKPNALKHGATSKIVLLWGENESRSEFMQLDECRFLRKPNRG